ncbi:hypothetical protein [Bifidobacterium moukalabense]|nr:hypothetical protein [Bifidobacterium moukalabense]
MAMIMERNTVRLAPSSLNIAGVQASPLLETCLAALCLASASVSGMFDWGCIPMPERSHHRSDFIEDEAVVARIAEWSVNKPCTVGAAC